MATVAYPHIMATEDGQLRIAGTGVKVVMLVMQHLAYRWDAEELQRQYPHLSLGQVHSALAYYYDHENELNAEIAKRLEREETLLKELGDSALRVKLRAMRTRQ